MFNNSTRFFIGIDNGTSGSIAIIGKSETGLSLYNFKTPTISQPNYTKKKSNITRINTKILIDIFSKSIPKKSEVHVMIERPMVNPTRFQATMSAIRALEATQTILESLGFGYEFLDSKEWQKALLPSGVKGDDLKSFSKHIGERLYPGRTIPNHTDADGLLIAHYCMLKYK